MDINLMNNEILKLRSNVLKEKDKDKKIQIYEEILDKVGTCFGEYSKMMVDGASELNKLNDILHELVDLSVRDPKECRKKLKNLHKSLRDSTFTI